MRRRIATYFAWLVFVGALLVAPSFITANNVVRSYWFSWLDVFATGALLFGPVIIVVSLVGGSLLALLERLTARFKWERVRVLPSLLTFIIFFAAWLRLFKGMLRINKIEWAWLNRAFELPVALIVAALLLILVPAGFARWMSNTGGRIRILSRLCIVAIVGLLGYALLEPFYRGSVGQVQLPQDGTRPNIIVVVLDGLTTYDMSLYGYQLPTTPRLDELTKTWTIFDNAHSTATATTAVQPAILTGRYPYVNAWQRYGDLARTGRGVLSLPRILQELNYETIYAMGGGWTPARYHFHTVFDQIIGAGYPAFLQEERLIHTFPGHDMMNRTVWNPTVAQALLPKRQEPPRPSKTSFDEPMYGTVMDLFAERAQSDDPFFVYFHTMRPHPPYFGNEFTGTFLAETEGLTNTRSQNPFIHKPYKPEDQVRVNKLRLRYDESILKADQELGQLIDSLKANGLYDESMIVITSDHGTSFTGGVQGYFSTQVRASEHHVPLLVKFPWQTEGQRVENAVSLVDILPTVLDVLGVSFSPSWTDGQSLRVADQHPERIVYVTRMTGVATLDYNRIAVIQGPWKFVRRRTQDFMFNLANDPNELTSMLARGPTTELRNAMEAFKRRATMVSASGNFSDPPLLP